MIARQHEHMIKHNASLSEYTTQALRATQPLRPRLQNIFDPHIDNTNSCQATQDKINAMEQDSLKQQLSRKGTVNESVTESLNAVSRDLVHHFAKIPQADLDLAKEEYGRNTAYWSRSCKTEYAYYT